MMHKSADSIDAPYDPLNLEHTGDPNDRLATARATCPISTPRPRVHVVATNELVREVLADPEHYINRGNFTLMPDPPIVEATIITSMDGPEHAALRQFLRQWFAPRELRKQEARIESIVTTILGGLAAGQSIDFIVEVARKVPAWTVYALLGFPEEDWVDIQYWTDTVHDHLPNVPDDLPEQVAFFGYVASYLETRAGQGEPLHHDVIDGLVFSDGVSLEAAAGHIGQILFAGTATTTSLISNLMYELLLHRENWETLLADPQLINAAVEESLRHDAPLQYSLRAVVEDVELGGCPIGAGDRLALSLQSANRDESVWGPDAAEFRIDRSAAEAVMSFGMGIHTCLGAPLARLEAQVLLRRLLETFPGIRLADGFIRESAPEPMLRRPHTLEVVL